MRTRHKVLFAALVCLSAQAYGEPWPRTFSPGPEQSKFQTLGEKNGAFHYRTKHYRIESDQALNTTLLKKFTRSIESVAIVLGRIPLPLTWAAQKDLPLIKICATPETFRAAGGPVNAAGFYDGHHQHVLILKSQFFRPAKSSRLGAKPDFPLLVHELVHLHMHGYLGRTSPWFHEGVAEYLAAAHGLAGNFDFTKMESNIRRRIERYQNPELSTTRVTKLPALVSRDAHDWRAQIEGNNSYKLLEPYSASLLLIHYYFHGGDERKKEVTAYLESSAKITSMRQKRPVLFSPENARALEPRLQKFWKPHGLKLLFVE